MECDGGGLVGGVAYRNEETLTSVDEAEDVLKRRNPLSGRDGWVADLGPWYGLINMVNTGLEPWKGVGESGDAQRLPARIISHI